MSEMRKEMIDLSRYHNVLGRKHQCVRMLWTVVWGLLARPLPRSMGSGWKRWLLRLFGAKVYWPANLEMGHNACLASDVDCYNVVHVNIGANSTVSQGAFLCTASHDITSPLHSLVTAPIVIEDQVWVASSHIMRRYTYADVWRGYLL